jgi:hypothetical protein
MPSEWDKIYDLARNYEGLGEKYEREKKMGKACDYYGFAGQWYGMAAVAAKAVNEVKVSKDLVEKAVRMYEKVKKVCGRDTDKNVRDLRKLFL